MVWQLPLGAGIFLTPVCSWLPRFTYRNNDGALCSPTSWTSSICLHLSIMNSVSGFRNQWSFAVLQAVFFSMLCSASSGQEDAERDALFYSLAQRDDVSFLLGGSESPYVHFFAAEAEYGAIFQHAGAGGDVEPALRLFRSLFTGRQAQHRQPG